MACYYFCPVISPYYCDSYANLQINTHTGIIYDIWNNPVFHIEDTSFRLHPQRVLCDFQGNPIVTLYKKNMTLHGRCQVFRGKSVDPSELLFSVKRSSIIQDSKMIKLEVFLSQNKSESNCDFRVIVDNRKSSCEVYVGESPTIIATMKNNVGFNVWIHPNVDHAFIVILLMIIDKMKGKYYRPLLNLATDATMLATGVAGIV